MDIIFFIPGKYYNSNKLQQTPTRRKRTARRTETFYFSYGNLTLKATERRTAHVRPITAQIKSKAGLRVCKPAYLLFWFLYIVLQQVHNKPR